MSTESHIGYDQYKNHVNEAPSLSFQSSILHTTDVEGCKGTAAFESHAVNILLFQNCLTLDKESDNRATLDLPVLTSTKNVIMEQEKRLEF